MSTAVFVYSVPLGRLRAVPGSRDSQLLAAVQEDTRFFEAVDEIASKRDEGEEQPAACADAVRQIINGEPYNRNAGYLYGYAYEAICGAIGAEAGPAWNSIARSYDWFPKIDKALASLGIHLKVHDLLCRGALIEIPEPDDFPSLGWWTGEEVARAAQVLQGLGPARLGVAIAKSTPDVADAIEDIRSWIRVATGGPENWLVGVQS